MLRFSIFGFPVGIHWLFGVMAFLFGGGLTMQSAQDWPRVFVGMVVIFISIMVHELGHAWAARACGRRPVIELHAMGGLTIFWGQGLGRMRHFLVVLAGPAASVALLIFFILLLPFRAMSPLLPVFVGFGLWVNVVWTILNCLPILPLDGGQMLRDVLGPSRERVACVIGAVVATAAAVWAISQQQIFLAVLMGILAWSNFRGSTNLQGGVVDRA